MHMLVSSSWSNLLYAELSHLESCLVDTGGLGSCS